MPDRHIIGLFVVLTFVVSTIACKGIEEKVPPFCPCPGDAGVEAGDVAPDLRSLDVLERPDGDIARPPPIWPRDQGLQAVPVDPSTVDLAWPAAESQVGVIAYEIDRNTTTIARLGADQFSKQMVGLDRQTNYTFEVRAVDRYGRRSVPLSTDYKYEVPKPENVAPEVDETAPNTTYDRQRYLFEAPDPIQRDVDSHTMTRERMGLISGRVEDRQGNPLQGVRISIHEHPEYGYTLTRSDGRYSLALNGGGRVTVNFEHIEYSVVQRTVSMDWRDTTTLERVVMTRKGPKKKIDTTGSGHLIQSKLRKDADGQRRVTLFFEQGTTADATLPDDTTEKFSNFDVSVTEMTVGPQGPDAMPAELPPQSAYTFAVDITVDEAEKADAEAVSFSRPVGMYVDNFLGLPVGTGVPLGVYEDIWETWFPDKSGRVVEILGTDANGRAEIDFDGDGQPAGSNTLQKWNVTDDERRKIGSVFSAGETFWRVDLTHISRPDLNFVIQCDDANASCLPPQTETAEPPPADKACRRGGSTIECESQVLRESVSLSGTPFSLNYSSRFQRGYDYRRHRRFKIWDQRPIGLSREEAFVHIGERKIPLHPPSGPLSKIEHFEWDGTIDKNGRLAEGAVKAQLFAEFCYPPVCGSGVFGTVSGANGSFSCRRPICYASVERFDISGWRISPKLLGGWTLSAHHHYDPEDGRLYLGDGTMRVISRPGDGGHIVRHVAKNRSPNFGRTPVGLDVGPDGTVYYTEAHRLMAVHPDGTRERLAGSSTAGGGFSGDGGPAKQAELSKPYDVEVGPGGALYIADTGNYRIRKIRRDGTITTIAGTGPTQRSCNNICSNGGFGGDGGPGTQAKFNGPSGLAFGPDGSLYIADTHNHRIRRLAPGRTPSERIIETVAGTGVGGFAGDGGMATNAQLEQPRDVDVGPNGAIYIADYRNNRIREVRTDGTIDTIAGTALPIPKDEGDPTRILLQNPTSVSVRDDGTVYFGEWTNPGQIRRIDDGGVTADVGGASASLGEGSGVFCFRPSFWVFGSAFGPCLEVPLVPLLLGDS